MRFKRDHSLGTDEAKRRVDKVAAELRARFDLTTSWDGDDMSVSGRSVNGHIAVADRSVEVQVDLGLSLMLFERTIRSTIESALQQQFP